MGLKIIWFGVSERGFQVKDDITWMGGGLVVNGWQLYMMSGGKSRYKLSQ